VVLAAADIDRARTGKHNAMAEENNLVVFMAPHYNAIILRKPADTVTGWWAEAAHERHPQCSLKLLRLNVQPTSQELPH
jgi:hypothetical protein